MLQNTVARSVSVLSYRNTACVISMFLPVTLFLKHIVVFLREKESYLVFKNDNTNPYFNTMPNWGHKPPENQECNKLTLQHKAVWLYVGACWSLYTVSLDLLQLYFFFSFNLLTVPHKQQEISDSRLKHWLGLGQLPPEVPQQDAAATIWASPCGPFMRIQSTFTVM